MDKSDQHIVRMLGNGYEVNVGEAVFRTTPDSEGQLTFKPITGSLGTLETVNYKRVVLSPTTSLVWQEQDRSTVTAYWNLKQLLVYSKVTLPDHTFLNLNGTLKRIS